MESLEGRLAGLKIKADWQPPRIFDTSGAGDLQALEQLVQSGEVRAYAENIESAISELYDIEFPHEKDLPESQKPQLASFRDAFLSSPGLYAYFDWNQLLVRVPDKHSLRSLRTSRNRNLILAEEQAKLYDATILVAGLSVGSNIVEALVSMGIGGTFILSDMDVIEPSNLNRIRAPYHHVGFYKTDSIAMRMNEIDPYLNFHLYREGITEESLPRILDTHQPDIIVDEMDQLQIKILMRAQAKQRGLPLLSAADDGDSTMIDIERYDLDRDYPLFHGRIEDRVLERITSGEPIPRQELGMAIGKYFIGSSHIPLRMYESLGEVGKTLPSWPQLGSAAAQSGIAVAFCCYKILTGQPLRAGRHVVGPEQVLDPNIDDPEYQARLKPFQDMLDAFKL